MVHVLTQPQQKLQLNYKTTITQNHQKIELYGSSTTKELKWLHSSRWVGGAKTQTHAKMHGDAERQRHGMGGPTPRCGR